MIQQWRCAWLGTMESICNKIFNDETQNKHDIREGGGRRVKFCWTEFKSLAPEAPVRDEWEGYSWIGNNWIILPRKHNHEPGCQPRIPRYKTQISHLNPTPSFFNFALLGLLAIADRWRNAIIWHPQQILINYRRVSFSSYYQKKMSSISLLFYDATQSFHIIRM